MRKGFWKEFWKKAGLVLAGLFIIATIVFFIASTLFETIHWRVWWLIISIFAVGILFSFPLIFEILIESDFKGKINKNNHTDEGFNHRVVQKFIARGFIDR